MDSKSVAYPCTQMKHGFFFKLFCLHKETGLARLMSWLNLLSVDLVHCKYTHANKNVSFKQKL